MLSVGSFNALLKTLEEPPEHVKFFFATTDVQKVPTTILSRCQRFDLKRIPTAVIAKHLLLIAKLEGFALEPAAAEAVARGAEGGLRDAESMLDQLVAFCGEKITEADVLNIFGFTGTRTVVHLCEAILNTDAPAALSAVHEQAEAGKDLGRLMSDLISHLRNLLVLKADPGGLGEEFTPEAIATLQRQADSVAMEKLLDLIEHFAGSEARMRWAPNKKMHFEVAAIRAIQTLQSATLTQVLDSLTALRGGQVPPAPAPARAAKAAAPAPSPPATQEPPAKVAEPAPKPPPAQREPAPPAAELKGEEFWAALVNAVRGERKLITAWLESGTLLGIEGSSVLIGFPPDHAFSKDLLEQDHKDVIEKIASSILGRRMTVRMEVREGIAGVRPVPAAPAAEKRDPVDEFKNDPLIRKALEIFKAEIQPA
jgi:DNA polymerase-3 subunit gamma/tau